MDVRVRPRQQSLRGPSLTSPEQRPVCWKALAALLWFFPCVALCAIGLSGFSGSSLEIIEDIPRHWLERLPYLFLPGFVLASSSLLWRRSVCGYMALLLNSCGLGSYYIWRSYAHVGRAWTADAFVVLVFVLFCMVFMGEHHE